MILERLKAKTPEKVTQEKEKVVSPDHLEKAPWFVKLAVRIKIAMSETEPFKLLFITVILCFFGFAVVGFMLPWMEVMQEVPNKVPILSIISGLTMGIFIADRMNRNIRENICEVSIGGKTFMTDNRKVDIYEGGHIIYEVNYYGKPILCKDESNMRRWGKQKSIFLPKQVIEQFDSVLGRRAKAYPDCKLKSVYMKDVDQGILYIPRKLSETRLLKKVEVAEQNLTIYHEMVEKFKADAVRIVSDLRGHESELLKSLITNMNALQQAMWGTPEKMRQMVNQQMYGRSSRYGGYSSGYNSPYNRYSSYGGSSYGSERGSPPWSDMSPSPPVINRPQEEEE